MRFGIALALLISVFVALYVAPAMRQFAHQFGGHVQPRANDLKFSVVHAERIDHA